MSNDTIYIIATIVFVNLGWSTGAWVSGVLAAAFIIHELVSAK